MRFHCILYACMPRQPNSLYSVVGNKPSLFIITDELIAAIKEDIRYAENALEQPDMQHIQNDNFFAVKNYMLK